MHWVILISLSATITCLALGIIVFSFNRKEHINRLFFVTSIAVFIYGFTTIMMWMSPTFEAANFWHKMGTMWPLFIALVLNFALVFTKSKWLKNKWNYLIIYLPAFTLWFIDLFTYQINARPIMEYWGYNDMVSGTPIYYISTVWTALIPTIAFIVCLRYYLKATDPTERIQAKLVTIGFSIPIATFMTTNILTRILDMNIPNLGISSTLFLSFLVAYAIMEYELFTVDAALASEEIIATIPDSFILADEKAQILRMNERLVNFLGFSEKDLHYKKLSVLFDTNQEEKLNYILNELNTKNSLINYEIKLKTKTGEIKHVLFSGSIVRSKKGKPIGITCVMKDITGRIEMETKLLKSERLASIGELAGQIGHDLRNPLAAIKSSVYLLKKKNASMPETERLKVCEWIETAIADSDRIVNSLVEYSTDFQLQHENCSPKALTAKALLKLNVPQRIKVLDLTTEEPKLYLDAQRMEMVFTKLIQNAFDSIPNEGQLEISSINKDGNVEVSFTDSGAGIPKEVMTKLFSPLVTTKAKGMGMGLAICKRIVEAHSGKITFETSNAGSKFTVKLPIEKMVNV